MFAKIGHWVLYVWRKWQTAHRVPYCHSTAYHTVIHAWFGADGSCRHGLWTSLMSLITPLSLNILGKHYAGQAW
eukprot:XP_001702020.1 predicted protein [Chlamydomonas reinhardtii]